MGCEPKERKNITPATKTSNERKKNRRQSSYTHNVYVRQVFIYCGINEIINGCRVVGQVRVRHHGNG